MEAEAGGGEGAAAGQGGAGAMVVEQVPQGAGEYVAGVASVAVAQTTELRQVEMAPVDEMCEPQVLSIFMGHSVCAYRE